MIRVPSFHLLRTVFWLIPAIAVYTIVLGTMSIVSTLLGGHGQFAHRCARWWSWLILATTGVRVSVEGLEQLTPGATYVFDKGYCHYNWWHSIHEKGARWVTRFKRDAALTLLSERPVASHDGAILRDSVVAFALRTPRGSHRNSYSAPLRRIEVARPDAAPLVLATNDLTSAAQEIALLYKQRWQIELFFKWVKQHLQIRRFLGHNENAVRIQLLTALIAYMLVLLLKKATAFPGSMWMLLAQLRATLFQRECTEQSNWRRRRTQQAQFAAVQPLLL